MALAGRGFLAWYNARLTSHPYSVKAFGTGATYVASDCTAQAIEGEQGVAVQDVELQAQAPADHEPPVHRVELDDVRRRAPELLARDELPGVVRRVGKVRVRG